MHKDQLGQSEGKIMSSDRLNELEKICSNLVSCLLSVEEIIPDKKIDDITENIRSLFHKTGNYGFLVEQVGEDLRREVETPTL